MYRPYWIKPCKPIRVIILILIFCLLSLESKYQKKYQRRTLVLIVDIYAMRNFAGILQIPSFTLKVAQIKYHLADPFFVFDLSWTDESISGSCLKWRLSKYVIICPNFPTMHGLLIQNNGRFVCLPVDGSLLSSYLGYQPMPYSQDSLNTNISRTYLVIMSMDCGLWYVNLSDCRYANVVAYLLHA